MATDLDQAAEEIARQEARTRWLQVTTLHDPIGALYGKEDDPEELAVLALGITEDGLIKGVVPDARGKGFVAHDDRADFIGLLFEDDEEDTVTEEGEYDDDPDEHPAPSRDPDFVGSKP